MILKIKDLMLIGFQFALFSDHATTPAPFEKKMISEMEVAPRYKLLTDMEFVKNFTQPDFRAINFTTQKCVNCDIFLANQQRKCIKYQ